jgi:hypothetical protein
MISGVINVAEQVHPAYRFPFQRCDPAAATKWPDSRFPYQKEVQSDLGAVFEQINIDISDILLPKTGK